MNGNTKNNVYMDPLTKQGDFLELEQPPQQQQQPTQTPMGFLQSLWALIVAYATYYRVISSIVLAGLFILVAVVLLDSVASHATSRKFHHLTRDYSHLPSLYDLKMAQIDHWCLQGGDNQCKCNDPTEPYSREDVQGWTKAHALNRKLGDSYQNWDIVVLGDEFVEDFNGRSLAKPDTTLKPVLKYWNSTFTTSGGGNVDGLALGISGDSISNLLWRTQHGELPDAKVYWIHIGTNDFGKGQCSEEAVLLGILRLAELIHDERPGSVIVLNSILPRKDALNKKKKNKTILWRAIQEVNAQLESFCVNHEHLVYFDATPLFVNSNLPSKKNTKHKSNDNAQVNLRNPMYEEDKFHLSLQGHKTWGNAILERLKLILYDDDESSN